MHVGGHVFREGVHVGGHVFMEGVHVEGHACREGVHVEGHACTEGVHVERIVSIQPCGCLLELTISSSLPLAPSCQPF